MASTEMRELFDQAQLGTTNHKKYTKLLYNIYQKRELKDFFNEFKKYLLAALVNHMSHSYANSIIKFATSFCVEIISDYEKRMREINKTEEHETHPLFVCVVSEILKYVSLVNFNIRFHSCQFLGMLFTNFGPDITITDVICDKIQRAMLKRITEDPKPQIRIQAIKVLTRLQNPLDRSCPVIESFINSLADPIATVRKAIVENIAPCRNTFSHIIMRLRDTDASVRIVTYVRLSKISPRSLTIAYRQTVLTNGLLDSSPSVKQAFQQVLLPKWLSVYDSNVIGFMLALKLDAHEEDYKRAEQIYERLLPIIFKTMSLQELLQLLELEKDTKVIPAESLTTENVTYWYSLINYIKELEESGIEKDDVTPPVVNLISCINSFVKSKFEKSLEGWQYLEYQQVLRKLFELLWKLDNSDEFGRQAMQKCIISILTKVKMEEHVLNVVIRVFHTIIPEPDKLAYELCSITADIKDPLETEEMPEHMNTDLQLQIAQVKVKRHLLTDELTKAVSERDYQLMDKLSKEGEILERQLKDLEEQFKKPVQVRKPCHDADTICRCMDIMIAFLVNVHIDKLPNSLITFKDEFLQNEEIDFRCPGVYRRIFRIHCLYSIVDKNIALERLELIWTPLIGYRVSFTSEKKILEIAVGTISDLIRIYGPEIFESFTAKEIENSNETLNKRTKDRTLYCEGDYDSEPETTAAMNVTNTTTSVFIDIMLSMLDDDNPDFRVYVAIALMKLVVRGLCVNSSLVARLLLKWFNPILDTDDVRDQKVQRYIGEGLTKYINEIQTAPACLESAIIPTLCYIGNAPKTSPLAEVNYDDVLHCLIKFTRIRETATLNIHKHVAYSILSRVTKTKDPAVRILTKMLTYLDVPIDEPEITKELSQQIASVQEDVNDKLSLTYLKRYFNKLNAITGENNESCNTIANNTSDATSETTRTSTPARGPPKKRRSDTATDIRNIEETTDPNRENSRLSTLSNKNSRNVHSVPDLHTIEEQTEGVSDKSCTIQTSSLNDSIESNNSVFTDGNEEPHASPKRRSTRKRTKNHTNQTGNVSLDASQTTERTLRKLRCKSSKT